MKKLTAPFSKKALSSLKAGDEVSISGELLTARDAAHKKMFELLKAGKKIPVSIKDQIIYYVGPTPAAGGRAIGSAGPTTSSRMDKYAPALLKAGLIGMIGKGKRNKEVVDAIIKNKAVYFATYGGAGAYLSKKITGSKTVAYPELGTEAIRRMMVKDFPAVVAIDSRGRALKSFK